jgi:hypothetical protein
MTGARNPAPGWFPVPQRRPFGWPLDDRMRVDAHPALTGRALELARSSGPRMLRLRIPSGSIVEKGRPLGPYFS